MPNRAFSKLAVPDTVLSAAKPLLTDAWDWAVAGWAVLVWLYAVGVLVANVISDFNLGIATEFDNMPVILLLCAATFVVVTALSTTRRKSAASTSSVLSSALVLLGAWGMLAAVIAVIGFFVSLGLSSSPVFYAVENISGLFVGATIAVWALGELVSLPKATQRAPQASADGLSAAVAMAGSVELGHLVPGSVSSRKETARSWEVASLGWMVATWIFVLDVLVYQGDGADFRGVTAIVVFAGPLVLLAVTAATRSRYASTDGFGRTCLDLANLLAGGLGALLLVLSVIDFFASFGDHGAGNVLGGLLMAAGRVFFGAVVAVWALGEIAFMRGHRDEAVAVLEPQPVQPAPPPTSVEPAPTAPAQPPGPGTPAGSEPPAGAPAG